MKLFCLLLISHFFGDYLSYIRRLSYSKRSKSLDEQFLANFIHAFIHGIWTALVVSSVYNDTYYWFKVAWLVFIFHFIIDFLRCILETRVFKVGYGLSLWHFVKALLTKDSYTLWLYRWSITRGVIDQLVHLGSLYLIVRIV